MTYLFAGEVFHGFYDGGNGEGEFDEAIGEVAEDLVEFGSVIEAVFACYQER